MRVLFLPLYPPEFASSRYRVYQYLPLLRELGVEPEVDPAPGATLWARAASRGSRLRLEAACLRTALARARRAGCYDAVVLQKACTPSMLRGVASQLLRSSASLFYDIDDAVYISPPHRFRGPARLLQDPREPEVLARGARAVLAGSGELARWAGSVGGRPVLLPTCVDTDRFAPAPEGPASGVVGWIGSPSTAGSLSAIGGALARVCAETGARFVAVGADRLPEGVDGELVPWSLDCEARLVAGFTVGVAPLPDTPWNRGKCALKALLYMSCAVPVVASPVGALAEVVVDGETGILASTEAEWEEALRRLLGDPALRRRMGRAGRERVRERYCLRVGAGTLARVLAGEAAG